MAVSTREAEVLAAVGEHLTNAEIGAKLFISVRTVESHVSSLLRKLQVHDRRGLAVISGSLGSDAIDESATRAAVASLPSPLTPFVGRSSERAALSAALGNHRQVTALGPGGVGKTRLAVNVAASLIGRFSDGVWYVDLVPVADAQMIAPAIALALGLGESDVGSATDDVAKWLSQRETLLVLDNCEHLRDSVVVLLERLLASGPRLTVLVTSRARLLVPFETVFPVPGLSVKAASGGLSDAVALFLERAAAAGGHVSLEETQRIAALCGALDGMALSIELAAARLPTLGLDGVEAGLSDRLRLLTGGARVDERHRSLGSTLDWSYALLDDTDKAVLRRVSVFASTFTATAAAAVLANWPPVSNRQIPTVLARLADQSLLVAMIGPTGTRYRVLESVRQYGADQCEEAGESQEVLSRHLRWSLDEGSALALTALEAVSSWRAAFDQVADELRSALTWSAGQAAYRPESYRLAVQLAHLTFIRGMSGESQRRYEQAAELAPDDLASAEAWRCAAGAAESRLVGTEALRLHMNAVDAALRAGDRPGAAVDLARNAELINRYRGIMAAETPSGEVEALISRGWALADGDQAAQARLLIAEAFNSAVSDPVNFQKSELALTLGRGLSDPRIESAALDLLTSVHASLGDLGEAAASASRRIELLAPLAMTATGALECLDAFIMAADCAIATGDLADARALSQRLRELPFHREEGQLATARLLVVTTLSGDWRETVGLAERFREGWDRSGRPRAGDLSRGAYAAATVYGLRGDEANRSAWLEVVEAVRTPGRSLSPLLFGDFLDASLLLHRGLPEQAMQLMDATPEQYTGWHSGLWRCWYAAAWVEAAVLSEHPSAADRIRRARSVTGGNPIATAIVDRAEALTTPGGGSARLIAAAEALRAGGCRYQWARTLVILGGDYRVEGEAMLSSMGATPMVWPPEKG